MARKSKAEKIYNYVRDQIFLGRWKMGERLDDLEIAEEVRVSRVSVKEALYKLLETGIIEQNHCKDYFIKQIEEKIISDIVELRVLLESEAVKNLITEGTEKDFAEMEQSINKAEELLLLPQLHYCLNNNDLIGRAINKNNLSNFLTVDYHFHELIHSCQHNSCITKTLKEYSLAIHFVRYIDIGKDENYIETMKCSLLEHRLILEALRLRDTELAVERLAAHYTLHEEHAIKEFLFFKLDIELV